VPIAEVPNQLLTAQTPSSRSNVIAEARRPIFITQSVRDIDHQTIREAAMQKPLKLLKGYHEVTIDFVVYNPLTKFGEPLCTQSLVLGVELHAS
jgi:hypothetical protein